jgi:hypothetical protein
VKKERFKKVNFDFTVRLQDKTPKRLDGMWEDIAFFVSPVVSIACIGILTVVALVDIKNKKLRPGALLIPIFFAMMATTVLSYDSNANGSSTSISTSSARRPVYPHRYLAGGEVARPLECRAPPLGGIHGLYFHPPPV